MNLPRQDLLNFFDEVKSRPLNQGWVEHALCVGDTAGKIAAALNHHGLDLDTELVTTLGYFHDIGKLDGNFNFLGHILAGYAWAKRHGYDDAYAHICLTHSFIKNDPYLTLSTPVLSSQMLSEAESLRALNDIVPQGSAANFLADFIEHHEFTLPEKIISLCDLICLYQPLNLDDRIADIVSRHGTCATTQEFIHAAHALKDDFDHLLGEDLYRIIHDQN